MPALYKAITEIKDPFRRRAFQSALVAEWVQLDAPGGLKFYLGKGPDKNQRRQFIEEWLALDANAAADGLLASGPGWESVARDCLPEFARRAPSRLAEIVARLPEGDYWNTNVRDAFAIAAGGDLSSARKAAESLSGPNREQALAGVAQAWAKNDFNNAISGRGHFLMERIVTKSFARRWWVWQLSIQRRHSKPWISFHPAADMRTSETQPAHEC